MEEKKYTLFHSGRIFELYNKEKRGTISDFESNYTVRYMNDIFFVLKDDDGGIKTPKRKTGAKQLLLKDGQGKVKILDMLKSLVKPPSKDEAYNFDPLCFTQSQIVEVLSRYGGNISLDIPTFMLFKVGSVYLVAEIARCSNAGAERGPRYYLEITLMNLGLGLYGFLNKVFVYEQAIFFIPCEKPKSIKKK